VFELRDGNFPLRDSERFAARLAAGGSRIRTLGPPRRGLRFETAPYEAIPLRGRDDSFIESVIANRFLISATELPRLKLDSDGSLPIYI